MFVEQLRIEAELEKHPKLRALLGKNLEKFIKWVVSQRVLHQSDIRQEVQDFMQIYLPYQEQKKKEKRKRSEKQYV